MKRQAMGLVQISGSFWNLNVEHRTVLSRLRILSQIKGLIIQCNIPQDSDSSVIENDQFYKINGFLLLTIKQELTKWMHMNETVMSSDHLAGSDCKRYIFSLESNIYNNTTKSF